MYKADLRDCSFSGCHFDSVNLTECLLEGAQFTDCSFDGASISSSNFDKVTFSNCKFNETEMCFTDFGATDLSGCMFEKCWITRARMSRVKALTQKQLESFFGDDSTVLPEHLERPEFWPRQGDITTWRRWNESGDIIESKASVSYE